MRVMAMAALLLAVVGQLSAEPLKVYGSTTVNPVASLAAEVLRQEKSLTIQIDTQGGSTGGISALGDGLAQIAMSSRSVSDADRKKYPTVNFFEHRIGADAVAVVVNNAVWKGGVRTMTVTQARDIYEGKVKSWKDLGGTAGRIVFFNREPGRGEWEVFGKWTYGDPKKVPSVSHPELGGNEETRNKVGSTPGGVTFLSVAWADGKKVNALAVKGEDGKTIEPTGDNIASGAFPMSRPLFLITNGEPSGDAATFIQFVLSERGQKFVRDSGYLSLDQVKPK